MTRYFGIAGIQMAVEPWDANATVDKMHAVANQVRFNFPWVDMLIFHELVVPGLVQFVGTERSDTWRQDAQTIPGLLTDRLCEIARQTRKWLVPGSMYEVDGDHLYNTALVISPDGEIITKYRKMFPWLPYEAGTTAGTHSASSTYPMWGVLVSVFATIPGFPRRCAIWPGWAPKSSFTPP